MEITKLITTAIQEIEHPSFAVTEQFLEIHEIDCQEGKPEIAGIKTDDSDELVTIYFAVKGEAFHFAVYLKTGPEIQVIGADTEDFCHVYFFAYSESLSLHELTSFTSLKPTDSNDIGDKSGFRDAIATVSLIEFKPNPEPGATEEKLKKLLTFLEQDVAGVRKLVDKADGAIIQVHTVFHNGNSMLGGIHLDKEDLQRLAALDLGIDFDLYSEGNKFK